MSLEAGPTSALPAAPSVALVSLPFLDCSMPSLGMGMLKASLSASGLASTVYDLNLDFLPELGATQEEALQNDDLIACRVGRGETLLGEWLFTAPDPDRDERYEELLRRKELEPDRLALFRSLRPKLDERIGRWARRIVDAGHDIVGLSCSFHRTRACVRLAGAIRSLAPGTRLIVGGFPASGDMGLALLEAFEVFDLVCHTEGEPVIVPIVRALRGEPGATLEGVRGISYRSDGRIVTQMEGACLARLDEIPSPDYDGYFEEVSRLPSAWNEKQVLPRSLPIETSRGCWWGARQHCSFCSLNGDRMTFRPRSPGRVLEEIDVLRRRYGTMSFFVVDNILHHEFFETLLPRLASERRGAVFTWEIRPDVGRDEAATLARAGVWHIQPGIESLSTPVLLLLRKGTTAVGNVQALKWLEAYGIRCSWNLLVFAPGEKVEWYEEMARLIPRLVHLPPPTFGPSSIAAERFSPLFTRPEQEGVRVTGPNLSTRLVFGDISPDLLARLCYDFDHEIPGRLPDLDERIREVLEPPLRAWREAYEARGCTLSIVDGTEESLLVIGPLLRPKRMVRVRGLLRRFLKGCESICRERTLLERLGASASDESAPEEDGGEPPLDARSYRRLSEELGYFGVRPEEAPAVTLPEVIDFADERGWAFRESGRILSLPVNQTHFVQSGPYILQEALRRYQPS